MLFEMDRIMQIVKSDAIINWSIISIFMLLVMVGIIFITTRLILYKKREAIIDENTTMEELDEISRKNVNRPYEVCQMVFEILISNTCVIVMMYVYDRIANNVLFLEKYLGIVMIILIILAIMINNFLDEKLVQDMLKKEEKGNIRLLSSCSILLIFFFFKFYFHTAEYDDLLLCYIGLVLGRFIYFDSSLEGIKECFRGLKPYILPLIIGILFTGAILGVEIYLGIITTENVFFSLTISHVFILYFIHITKKIIYELMEYQNF